MQAAKKLLEAKVLLTAEELLAGSRLTFEVQVPPELLYPPGSPSPNGGEERHNLVRLRPLTVADLQSISKAARENDQLVATLMVQRALVEPELSVAQAAGMHVGLAQYLLKMVNQISGMAVSEDELSNAAGSPLARAAHLLAKEYGWTPEVINDLTLGQVLLHLELLREGGR